MRMRSSLFVAAAMAVAAFGPGAAIAQKPAEPTIEVRLRSVNDLLGTVEALVAHRPLASAGTRPAGRRDRTRLSTREEEILTLLASGLSIR